MHRSQLLSSDLVDAYRPLSTTSLAILTCDPGGRVVDCNPAAAPFFGRAAAAMVGRPLAALLGPEHRDQSIDELPGELSARRGGEVFAADLERASFECGGRRFHTLIFRDRSLSRSLERQLASMFEVVAGLLAGHVIGGRYRLEQRWAVGPRDSLYEATDLELREPVALRVLHAPWPDRAPPRWIADLPRNAAEILELGVSEPGLPYAVLEPLSGESVADRRRRGRRITAGEARRWGRAIADSIASAHAAHMTHGHLSDASLFVRGADSPAESPVVLGFELAALGAAPAPSAFAAPELAADPTPTRAADVWSLAIALGVLFSGGESPGGPAREWLATALPGPLASLGAAAVEPDPARRPAAAALARTLAELER